MSRLKPQARFLLRGSTLIVAMLSIWWFVLLNPLLAALQIAASPFLHIEETPSRDWTLTVPIEKTLPAMPQQPVAQQIHSIDFDLPRTDVTAFTFSLPVYWALIFAAPGFRRSFRPLLLGTLLMGVVELVLLLVFAQIAAHNTIVQVTGVDDAFGKWLRHLGEYLIENMLPYATPFAVALALHPGLREAIFALAPSAAMPAVTPSLPAKKRRR
jgi:hypothetical protein